MSPELLEYIRQRRAQGVSDPDISRELLRAGWEQQVVQEALKERIMDTGSSQPSSDHTKPQGSSKSFFALVAAIVLVILAALGAIFFLYQNTLIQQTAIQEGGDPPEQELEDYSKFPVCGSNDFSQVKTAFDDWDRKLAIVEIWKAMSIYKSSTNSYPESINQMKQKLKQIHPELYISAPLEKEFVYTRGENGESYTVCIALSDGSNYCQGSEHQEAVPKKPHVSTLEPDQCLKRLDQTYTNPKYGYLIKYPSGWTRPSEMKSENYVSFVTISRFIRDEYHPTLTIGVLNKFLDKVNNTISTEIETSAASYVFSDKESPWGNNSLLLYEGWTAMGGTRARIRDYVSRIDPLHGSSELRTRQIYFVDSNHAFSVQITAHSQYWKQNEKELMDILESFVYSGPTEAMQKFEVSTANLYMSDCGPLDLKEEIEERESPYSYAADPCLFSSFVTFESKENNIPNYSYMYPKDWELSRGDNGLSSVHKTINRIQNRPEMLAYVFRKKASNDEHQYKRVFDDIRDGAKSVPPRYTVLSDTVKKLDGVTASVIEFISHEGWDKKHQRMMMFSKDGYDFWVSLSADEGYWNLNSNNLKRVFDSFMLSE